jgi:hypothetical protein
LFSDLLGGSSRIRLDGELLRLKKYIDLEIVTTLALSIGYRVYLA